MLAEVDLVASLHDISTWMCAARTRWTALLFILLLISQLITPLNISGKYQQKNKDPDRFIITTTEHISLGIPPFPSSKPSRRLNFSPRKTINFASWALNCLRSFFFFSFPASARKWGYSDGSWTFNISREKRFWFKRGWKRRIRKWSNVSSFLQGLFKFRAYSNCRSDSMTLVGSPQHSLQFTKPGNTKWKTT